MSRFGLARSIQSPHQECQIACGGLNQQFLVRVVAASHVQLVHTSRVELMCKVSLQSFPARDLQALATLSSNPPSIGIHGRLFRLPPFPLAGTAFWLGDVG